MAVKNATHVIQSHDPERALYSHVVQNKGKKEQERLRRFQLRAPQTKAEQAEELRRAVLNTREEG